MAIKSDVNIFWIGSHETFYGLVYNAEVDSYKISEQTGARLSSVVTHQFLYFVVTLKIDKHFKALSMEDLQRY